MPEENVELVRRSFEAWNRNDWEALKQLYDADVEAVAPTGWPETGVIRGYDEVRIQFERNKDSWEEEHVEIDEIREVSPELVLARIRWVTKGKESGIPFESPISTLFRLRGRIVRIEYYFNHAEALEAAGLAE
jgi:ketosteroid isomerase-like protein